MNMDESEKRRGPLAGIVEDRNNKIVLLLTGALVLGIFMDTQARRHYEALSGREVNVPVLEQEGSLSEIMDGESVDEQAPEPVVGDSFTEEYTESEAEKYSQEAVLRPMDPSPLAVEQVSLYFIRYRGKHSSMVRVIRDVRNAKISYETVVRILQKGPRMSERGLLNAFDESIKLHSVSVESGIATVDVSSAIGKMSSNIIKDRIDQLTLTLTQFTGIRGIRILIDGKPVHTIGSEKIPLPETIGPPDRNVKDYSTL